MELEHHRDWNSIPKTRRISNFFLENSYIEMTMLSKFYFSYKLTEFTGLRTFMFAFPHRLTPGPVGGLSP
jgi:hypothetical protein